MLSQAKLTGSVPGDPDGSVINQLQVDVGSAQTLKLNSHSEGVFRQMDDNDAIYNETRIYATRGHRSGGAS